MIEIFYLKKIVSDFHIWKNREGGLPEGDLNMLKPVGVACWKITLI